VRAEAHVRAKTHVRAARDQAVTPSPARPRAKRGRPSSGLKTAETRAEDACDETTRVREGAARDLDQAGADAERERQATADRLAEAAAAHAAEA
jgi:hypothetical protein